jgi:hypothetical protein
MASLPVFLLFLFAATASDTPASVLEGCRAIASAGVGWQYECGDLTARVEDHVAADWAKASSEYVQGAAVALASALGNEAEKTRQWRHIGTDEAEVHCLRTRDGRLEAWITGLHRPAGVRVLICATKGRTDRSCEKVLPVLAAAPWRGGAIAGTVVKKEPVLNLNGRAVLVPAGCEAYARPGGGHLNCPPLSFADWAVATSEEHGRRVAEEWGQRVSDNARSLRLRLDAGAGVSVRRDEVRCKLAGSAAMCGRMKYDAPDFHVVSLWAVARVQDQWVFANCQGPDSTPITSPCALIFSIE